MNSTRPIATRGNTEIYTQREVLNRVARFRINLGERPLRDLDLSDDDDFALVSELFAPPLTEAEVLAAIESIAKPYRLWQIHIERCAAAEMEVRYLFQSLPPDQHPTREQVDELYRHVYKSCRLI